MKKHYKILMQTIACMVILCSCVDDKYDLSDIKTDDITIGNGFVVPMGDISIDLTPYLSNLPHASQSKAVQTVTLEPFEEAFELDSWFDQELIDKLTEVGTIKVIADVDYTVPVKLQLTIFFSDIEGENPSDKITVVNSTVEGKEGVTRIETLELNKELLTRISNSRSVNIKATPVGSNTLQYDDSEPLTLNIRLIIQQIGGIKL